MKLLSVLVAMAADMILGALIGLAMAGFIGMAMMYLGSVGMIDARESRRIVEQTGVALAAAGATIGGLFSLFVRR
jgi:hypothetical protein